ncbi:uracil-DNA glycosylase, family 4 [Campylobacter geochelonis]|nr:uracil-DNA glycosylase, family 4 [Campylobacter geochelonis]
MFDEFSHFRTLDELKSELKNCQLCPFSKSRNNVVVSKKSLAKLMVVMENPTVSDDLSGEMFVGNLATMLKEMLKEHGGVSEDDIYGSFLVKCKAPKNGAVTSESVLRCSPYLFDEIKKLNPKVILTVGEICSKVVLKDENLPNLQISHGSIFKEGGAFVMPVFDMEYVLTNPSKKGLLIEDIKKIRELL